MIGYLALARETFDVEYAESKFKIAKSLLLSLSPDAIGYENLITNDEDADSALSFFNSNADFNYSIDKQTIGIIGTRPEGFDTCDYDSNEVTSKLNVSLVDLELEDLFDEAKDIEVETIVKTKSTVSSYLAGTEELVQEEFDKSLSIFHGLENLKDKHNLDAFAIRCWPAVSYTHLTLPTIYSV